MTQRTLSHQVPSYVLYGPDTSGEYCNSAAALCILWKAPPFLMVEVHLLWKEKKGFVHAILLQSTKAGPGVKRQVTI